MIFQINSGTSIENLLFVFDLHYNSILIHQIAYE